jgi:hypothetical protein
VLAKFDKDGKLTTPQVTSSGTITGTAITGTTGTFSGAITSTTTTSLDSRIGAVETNLGSQTTFAATSAARDAKRLHWDVYTTAATDASGYVTVTHAAGFTPRAVKVTAADTTFASKHAYAVFSCDTFGATTFRVRAVDPAAGSGIASQVLTISAFLGE